MVLTAADQHIFPFLNRQGDLAVAADLEIAAARGKAQPDSAAAVDHQRPRRQGMREHRHQRNGVERGGEDRAARRKRVGGRAGRRRDDQAVGALREGEHLVDIDLELDHMRHFTGMQHHLVNRQAEARRALIFADARLEQEAAFDEIVALQHLVQLLLRVVGIEVGEKAEIAAVNTDDFDVVARQHARRAEHIAVAADHHGEVSLLSYLRQRAGLDIL